MVSPLIIDFRYHVASLVAVFLALALGILVGTVMLGGDVLVEQQAAMITRLEKDFNTVRAEKRSATDRISLLEQDLKRSRQFEAAVLPSLVRVRLAGRQVGILITTDMSDPALIDKVREALQQAGATVTSVTTLPRLPDLTNQEKRAKVLTILQMQGPIGDARISEGIAKEVAGDLATGANAALPALASLKLAHTSGQYDLAADSVVVVSGRSEEILDGAPKIDEAVVTELKELGVPVVGVESSNAPFSQVHVFRSRQVATVDHVDTVPGLLSMVIALQGANASFGAKASAKQLIPDLSQWPN